jgi:hypothetical protein
VGSLYHLWAPVVFWGLPKLGDLGKYPLPLKLVNFLSGAIAMWFKKSFWLCSFPFQLFSYFPPKRSNKPLNSNVQYRSLLLLSMYCIYYIYNTIMESVLISKATFQTGDCICSQINCSSMDGTFSNQSNVREIFSMNTQNVTLNNIMV